MREAARRALLAAIALVAGAGAYWSARLAYAESLYQQGTAASVNSAATLAPGNADYERRRAELAEAKGLNPAGAQAALEAALRDNPGDSETRIALALRAEMRGDAAAAERELLEAARRDRGYDPRWSLANFYFRRQDRENFWKWARAACEMASAPEPLFGLLWHYSDNGREILSRAISSDPEIMRRYLWFLVSGPHWEAAGSVANRILLRPGTEDAPALLSYCDRLLGAGRGPEAAEVWNALARRKLIALAAVDPGRGPLDGAFRTAPTNSGFDWRIAEADGIAVTQDRPGLFLAFSGEEPEAWEPLWQYVALTPGARYRMTYEYATDGIAENSGLRWRVVDLTAEPAVVATSDDLAHDGWTDGSVTFTTPETMRLARLDLSYRRAPGTSRIDGSVRLRRVSLERAE
jgi:tetratricopeptide (TPR) repeat protein